MMLEDVEYYLNLSNIDLDKYNTLKGIMITEMKKKNFLGKINQIIDNFSLDSVLNSSFQPDNLSDNFYEKFKFNLIIIFNEYKK